MGGNWGCSLVLGKLQQLEVLLIGGFIAGGSGGIGSIRWGFLRDPGNLIGLEAVTMNEKPEWQ